MIKYTVREFCLNTGLHGYKFIVLPKRVLLERVIWLIITTISLVIATVIVIFALRDIENRNTQTVTDSTHNPIWNYAFPAVTICNYNQISKLKAYDAAQHIKRPVDVPGEEMARHLQYLALLMPTSDSNVPQRNLSRLQDILEHNKLSAHLLFQRLTPNCTEMLQRCKWKGEEKRCETLFEGVSTPMGFCCSFNYYAIKNHRFSDKLLQKMPEQPRRVTACGYKTALEVMLNNFANDYFASNTASHGHKILIHYPYSYPDWSVHYLLLQVKTTMYLSVSPTLTECSDEAAKLPAEKRNCLFRNEKTMARFKYYSHHNCLTECRMYMILRRCGCTPFYYFSHNGTFNKQRICNLRDNGCLTKYKGKIWSSIPGVSSDSLLDPKHNLENNQDTCTCLPDCESCKYSFESSNGEFSRKYSISGQNLYGGTTIVNQSVLRVFFNDLVAVRNTTIALYHWHTIFALLGGLLSLFTGFSFGTGIELLYYFSIRLIMVKVNKEDTNRTVVKEVKAKKVLVEYSILNKSFSGRNEKIDTKPNEKGIYPISQYFWPFTD